MHPEDFARHAAAHNKTPESHAMMQGMMKNFA